MNESKDKKKSSGSNKEKSKNGSVKSKKIQKDCKSIIYIIFSEGEEGH